jgi:hypothetical protein
MSPTYDVLLDYTANFLIFLSGAPSFWFLLDTSYDHGCTQPVAAITTATLATTISSAASYSL